MADDMVLLAQRFINSYNVAGIPKVEEDGKTGWSVMYALTRALQYELGMTTLSDSFGPATLTALTSRFPVIDSGTRHGNVYRIVQSGLFCKGYDGDEINGDYTGRVAAAVTRLKQHMGVDGVYPGGGLTPKVFKALLTMDPYVVVGNGTEKIRYVQQWMNGRYINRRNFFVIPCDGMFSRDVQKALLYAIQFELGMSDDVANGVFGPATRQGLRDHPVGEGSSGVWVNLFSAAMLFNRRPGVDFVDGFTSHLARYTSDFQSFVRLPVTGRGDFQTWASLLVSTGDATRAGTACDTVTEITDVRAAALYAAGYRYVGRYLSNVSGSTLNKRLQPGELRRIASHGLSVFPIYQTYGGEAAYFKRAQGIADAHAAITRARGYGFKPGTRIYFAVDFDALDYQVTDNILPHFRAIKATMDEYGREFEIGIYGPRNVCSRVAAERLTTASFLCDMSTGFSGNLGYPHPIDWSFDQISTISIGSGTGQITIDNNIASGSDTGQNSFNDESPDNQLDVGFDLAQRNALLADIQTYFVTALGVPEKGGPNGDDGTGRTTTESVDIVLDLDWLTTQLSRHFRMRKAMIQCPLLWEIRKFNIFDPVADDAVRLHYTTGVPTGKDDCSTGLAQIFGRTAIRGRNWAIAQGIISGTPTDPDKGDDIWAMWQKLNTDNIFNVQTVPAVLGWGAADLGLARPGLTTSEDDSRRIMGRYNGRPPDSDNYAQAMIGMYRVFEKYNAPLRS
ncbi:glycoside hydrolase domain-containing protein [Streptomyces coerulescens]|uniref:Glycoside hydrolase domain-containing protein n=1 Tax=Streptomyces coerulescens TaxID=29304 RepID=A0ABW0CX00_STRCD